MKNKIECPTCDKSSGLALGPGFSRRRFLQVAGTGIVASYFVDVVNPRLLYGATTAPNVALKNTAKNCIFIFLPGAPSNIDTWDLKVGAWTPSDFNPTTFDNGNLLFPQVLMPKTAGPLGKVTLDMNDFYNQSKAIMDAPNINALFSFSTDEHTRYGASTFGDSLVIARNLVAGRKGTRFVQATFGGWDHHSGIYDTAGDSLYTQMAQFDPAFGALLTDLQSMPGSVAGKTMLDETLVVVMAEFGRTVGALNNQDGRDHNLRMTSVWAGGGTRGGQVIGKTDATGNAVAEYGWSANRDVRPEDVTCTIYSALGIDYTTVRHDDPLGRGFEYVPFAKDGTYGPVNELF